MSRPQRRLSASYIGEERGEKPHGIELRKPALVVVKTTPKTIVYWIVTALFCLRMIVIAYTEPRLPQVAEAFTHRGFPAYFRVEPRPLPSLS